MSTEIEAGSITVIVDSLGSYLRLTLRPPFGDPATVSADLNCITVQGVPVCHP